VEVRNWRVAGAEQVLTYPHPAVKLLNGTTPAAATWLHRDGLASVRVLTDAAGAKIEAALYKPFGEPSEWVLPGNAAPESKGWIGERYDADAGLQYLNARYYDPDLSLFLQPDWFEVTKAGVGTNRFSYSFNDPVNKFDPGGNQAAETAKKSFWEGVKQALRSAFSGGSRAAIGAEIAAGGGSATALAAPVAIAGGIFYHGVTGPRYTAENFEEDFGQPGFAYNVGPDGNLVGNGIGNAADGTRVLAAKKPADSKDGARLLARYLGMVSTGLGTHANSLMSPEKNELYHLVRTSDPTIIDKIGITSAPGGGPTGRYTDSELKALGVDYVSVATFNNRLSARAAEVAANLNYFNTHGTLPKYTFRW
jgi:RHS repeat-associated protein